MSYTIARASTYELPELGDFDPGRMPAPFDVGESAPIALYPWADSGYHPAAFARVLWHEEGLLALMAAQEPEPRAVIEDIGGAVYTDSCLEFFFGSDAGGPYINLEINPRGVYHLGVGAGRGARRVFRQPPEGVIVRAGAPKAWWAVAARLDAGFLMREAGITLAPGARLKGNFYKCAEATARPHWGTCFPVGTQKPDFHRPEWFGELTLA